MTQLLPVDLLHQYSTGKWKDLIIAGVPVWVTAVQKAISCLTQLFSPVRVEEFGGETSLNVCVSFQGAVVLAFTKATISCLGLESVSRSLKRTQLDPEIYGLLQDSPSFFQKPHLVTKLSGCAHLRSWSSFSPQKSPPSLITWLDQSSFALLIIYLHVLNLSSDKHDD